MLRTIIFSIIFLFSTAISYSQNGTRDKLDKFFDILGSNDKFMGSVAVMQDGQIIYTKSEGYADLAAKIPINSQTQFRIGSISKSFTSVLIFKLIEKSKLTLETTLDRYFPDIKNSEKITIKMLLGHRSGIFNVTSRPDYLTWNTSAKNRDEMLTLIKNSGTAFEPDTKTEYSNSNYILLTYIIEDITKKPYKTVLENEILKPLKLTRTAFGTKINVKDNQCKSYTMGSVWNESTETDPSIPLGAGALISTPSDLTIFAQSLFEGKLISQSSLDQMKTVVSGMGLGLMAIPFYDMKGYGHTGGIDGFNSVYCYFPDKKLSYAMVSNGINYNFNQISLAVLCDFTGKEYALPVISNVQISAEELDKYTGTYSSTQIPLKITITRENNTLMAQATGQSKFPLEATTKESFKFDAAGVVMDFNINEGKMTLKQGGASFIYSKDK